MNYEINLKEDLFKGTDACVILLLFAVQSDFYLRAKYVTGSVKHVYNFLY